MRRYTFTEEQIAEIESACKAAANKAMAAHLRALYCYAIGASIEDICRQTGASADTIYKLAHRYHTVGLGEVTKGMQSYSASVDEYTFTQEQVAEISNACRGIPDGEPPHRRLEALYLCAKGESASSAARRLNVSPQTVQRIVSRYKENGLDAVIEKARAYDRKRKTAFTSAQVSELREMLETVTDDRAARRFRALLLYDASTNIFLAIVAMLLRVVPFFFIPGLVKGSLAALGNIGAKVSNLGTKAGRAGAALSASREAKAARQYQKFNKFYGEEAAAVGAGAHAMTRDSMEYAAQRDNAYYKRINEMAGNIEGKNTNIATETGELQSLLDQAMVDYNESRSDEDLVALQAYENMLISNGDPGMSAVENSLGKAIEAGLGYSAKALGQHLIRAHTKDVKLVARGLYAAAGKLQQGSFVQKNGQYTSLSHLARSIGGYDASNIGKANETSLQRMIDNADELKKDADFVSTFDGLSGDALRNGNIHIQPKAAKLINTLRKELGLNMIANNSGSNTTDSGTIQVQGNSQQGSAGGVSTAVYPWYNTPCGQRCPWAPKAA
ncbi:MAG: helix-turn-helix domain-containing protein [Lachnospiraceae bacterium]|nr:helix-turn-helix domain-containing protein [Lachnospiraceae bacterium]